MKLDAANMLAAVGVVALCILLGSTLRGRLTAHEQQTRPFRILLYALAGSALLYLWLLMLTFAGLRWSWASAVIAPTLLALGIRWRYRDHVGDRVDHRVGDRPAAALGWGDLFALYLVVVLAALLREPFLTAADFLFHWGYKAQRFWLVGGIDLEFLTREWNFLRHPDYPQLLPSLFATTALVRGAFTIPALIVYSAIFIGGTAVAIRDGLARAGVDRHLAQGGLGIIVATSVMGTIVLRLGGSPDLLIALLVTTGVVLFLSPPESPALDLQVGIVAAVAIGAKVEGMVLAALLVGGHLLRRFAAGGFPGWPSWLRTGLPPVLIAAPWSLTVARHGLAHGDRAGPPHFDQAGIILQELASQVGHHAWHGVSWCLLALPVLLIPRATRAPALLIGGQMVFYVWVYFTTTADPVELIRTSAARLVTHLLAATMLLLVIAIDRACRPGTIAP